MANSQRAKCFNLCTMPHWIYWMSLGETNSGRAANPEAAGPASESAESGLPSLRRPQAVSAISSNSNFSRKLRRHVLVRQADSGKQLVEGGGGVGVKDKVALL